MEISDLFGVDQQLLNWEVGRAGVWGRAPQCCSNFVSFSIGCGSSAATPRALVLFGHHRGNRAVGVKDQDPKSCKLPRWVRSLQDGPHSKQEQEVESRGSRAPQGWMCYSLPQQEVAVVKHWRLGLVTLQRMWEYTRASLSVFQSREQRCS